MTASNHRLPKLRLLPARGEVRTGVPAGTPADQMNDRRTKSRFRLELEVRYRTMTASRQTIGTGTGTTLNISSGGVWFTAQDWLPVGIPVELSVTWPALLNEACPIKLMIAGRVVRSYSQTAVVSVERYEFRTQASRNNLPA